MNPTQTPIQQPPQIPTPIITPQPKPNWILITLSVFSTILLVAIVLLSLQNQKLQKQVLNPPISPTTIQAPTLAPKKTSSISITPDETAGWKTYTEQENNFSFKYPPNYILSRYVLSDLSSPVLINNRIDWSISQYSAKECRGDCPINEKVISIKVNNISMSRIEGWVGSIGGEISQSFIRYEIKLPSEKYLNITLWELLRGESSNKENYQPDRKIQSIRKEDSKIFDQILSTFQFQK